MSVSRFGLASMLVVLVAALCAAQTSTSQGTYTQQQAQAGRSAFEANCAICHGSDLKGGMEAPPLSGPNFINAWGSRTSRDLLGKIQTAMPLDRPGSLSENEYLSIVSYLLQTNGIPAGAQEFTTSTAVKIAQGGGAAAKAAQGEEVAKPASKMVGNGDPQPGPSTATGVTVHGEVKNYQPVTDEMLLKPPAADWLMIRGNYQAWSHSALDQITPANVHELRPVWMWAMTEGSNQPSPLVHNGIMYLVNPGDVLQALDARTGDLIWEHRANKAKANGPMRNIAIYGDKIFMATTDARMLAIDARNGNLVWETRFADSTKGFGTSSGPIVAQGKVLQGLNGCVRFDDEGCYISAFDAETGKPLWRFNTIAQPGQPGNDTWGGMPVKYRGGTESWITGSYDPDTKLTYWGTAQAKPWVPASRGMTTSDKALYSSSTLALQVADGKLAWHFQHIPGEALDMDEVYERVLVDEGKQKDVLTIGKTGILWKLDRTNGKFLKHKETLFQNVFDKIDPKTGAVTYRADIANAKVGDWVSACPSTSGGHDWHAVSYEAKSGVIIIPLTQSCFEMMGQKVEFEEGSGGTAGTRKFYEMPGSEGKLGKLAAIDVKSMEQVWSVDQRATYMTSVLTTDGGVVFVGDSDRYFHAYDAKTGKQLWQTRLGTTVQGFPVTFSVDGKQYVAVSTGIGGGSPRRVPALLAPEIRFPNGGNALYVFALPDKN
ncbi:MAG TPA: PQQ-binding-like beta-propeller repeat protein [Terriglobales bacterium]|nr:PQQ-binding-like beta-propeller repeat protein [Terriglobales bacterium]